MKTVGLCRILAVFAISIPAVVAQAQDFPNREIRLIISYPPGGPADTSARIVGTDLSDLLGQPVVVENRPSPVFVPAMRAMQAAPADGHTLTMVSGSFVMARLLFKKVATFDPLKDVRAVAGVSKSPHLLLVAPSFPAKNMNDLIRIAREQPGKLNYGSVGTGSTPHLGMEAFKQLTGTQITQVPFKGSAAVLPAMMGGHVDVYFDVLFSAQALAKSGKLKALGVTGMNRVEAFPDLPTLDEQGLKGFELNAWFGIVARPETPNAVIAKLNEAINTVLNRPSIRQRLTGLGATPFGGAPEVLQKTIEADYQNGEKMIRTLGIAPD